MDKKRRTKHVDTNDVEPDNNRELETEDIYNDKQQEQILEEDKITAAENAFIEGKEMKKEEKTKKTRHNDSISVKLSKQEHQEN